MLCRLFPPFDDAFGCVQEWELNTQTHLHTVRLDFLHRISMASTTRYDSPAYYSKFRSAVLGGANHSIRKEVQRYHIVNQLYTEQEMRQILEEYSFFKSMPNPQLMSALEKMEHSPNLQPRVEVEELNPESIPTALLSAETLGTIHDRRHFQYLQRTEGKNLKF